MNKVTPLDAPTLFSPSEARCWSIGYNEAIDAMNADQPAACQHDFRHYMVGFNETGETRCRVCGFVVGTADQQSVSPTGDKGTIQPDDDISMQESPQPVDGTGKQSMQACTRNEAGLVQQCEDCEPYDEPHGPHCRSHPDYDGAPKE
jgi:hypothetical protein